MGDRRRVRRAAAGVTLDCLEAGPADGPLVILLHGFPEDAQSWAPQVDAMASAGLRVIAPDQRGYGASDRPAGVAAYALDRLAEDVLALADGLGRERFRLAGHDWGGAAAFWTAARGGARVERLAVMNAPHPAAMAAYVRRAPTQLLRSSYMAAFQLPALPERLLAAGGGRLLARVVAGSARPGAFPPAELARLRQGWSEPAKLAAMLAWYRALPRTRLRPDARRIACATLILWGRGDPFLEPGLAEASAALCNRGEIAWLETGHWLHREAPEQVDAALVRFLA